MYMPVCRKPQVLALDGTSPGTPCQDARHHAVLTPMRATRCVTAGAAFIVGASAVAGCNSSAGPAVSSHMPGRATVTAALYQSPEQAALSWFFAINHKDKAAAIAHFAPAAAGQMNWGNGNTSTWATFTALHCKQVSRITTTASVHCIFHESQAPSVGNPDSFWTVYLHRQPDGRWLITGYGQP